MLEQQKRTESDSIAVKLEELSAEKRPHASVSVEISLLRHRIAKLENKAAERRLAIERGSREVPYSMHAALTRDTDRKRNELIREEIAFRKSLLSTAKEGRALAKDPARESQMRGALDNRDIESKKLQSAQRRLIQELIQLFRLKVVNELALSPVASGLSNLNFSQTRYTLVDSDPFNPCNGPSGMPLNDFNSNIGLLAQLVTLLSHYLHYTLPFLLDCTGAGFVIRFGIEEDSA